jgi:hypothetical protein
MTRPATLRASLPLAAVLLAALAAAGCHRTTPAERAAESVVEKNAAARGGLKAWRAVHALALTGKLEAGRPRDPVKLAMSYLRQRNQTKGQARQAALAHVRGEDAPKPVQLPFRMELERPRRSRVEVDFLGQTAVQVYDGTKGWKLRPFLGRHEVEPFSAEELRVASLQTDLDGPLLDAAAKGSRVELEGKEAVEGRDAFKLKVTSKAGQVRQVWVDAETYLDVKVEDGARRLDGKQRIVSTVYRDFRPVDGLMVPRELETAVEGAPGSEKILVEGVTLNPRLADARFARPE